MAAAIKYWDNIKKPSSQYYITHGIELLMLLLLLSVTSVIYLIYFTQPNKFNFYWNDLQITSTGENPTRILLRMQNDSAEQSANDVSIRENKTVVSAKSNVTVDQEFFNYLADNLRDSPYPGVNNYIKYKVAQMGLSPLVNVVPLIPEFGPVINDVLSFQYPISIPPCRKNLNVNQTIVILVNSAPGNFDRRNIIRQTWKNHLTDMHEEDVMGIAGFAFVLGLTDDNDNVTQSKIEEEANTYGDIIQIGISDFYRNLSMKVAALFNWLYTNCEKVDFVVRVDDDVYINVRNLVQFVQNHQQTNQSMFGSAAGNLWPARDGKWKMKYEDWPWNSYPPYFLGPAVLFPSSVIVPLLAAFQTTPMMPIDDIYYTGICSEKAGVKLHSSSSNSTSVFTMGMAGVPLACDLRHFIAWMTVSENHMNNSHVATDDFYRNVTQCVIKATQYETNEKLAGVRTNKTILIWNSANILDTAPFGFMGYETFAQHRCEFKDCVIFDKASDLPMEEYDAILVHVHELWMTHLPNFQRRYHQRLVFLTQESPNSMHTIDVTQMGNLFNWTMSYKFDSDVQLLYGRISQGPTAPKTPEEIQKFIEGTRHPSARNYAANKTEQVAWMVSHCDTPSLRETYVRQLRKFIPVDIYGGCGNLTCPHSNLNFVSDPKCYDMMERKYKFYLSFENSICNDYVTEKFFEIMNHDMIPVVYGGANYSQLAPPHSYIDALEFTPEKLAEYLMRLDANDTLYNEYFWWKDHYQVEAGVEQMSRYGFCDLCKKLHQDDGVIKFYPELVSHWDPKTQCKYFNSWEN